ncbi:MAG: hypothetical protein JO114_08255 [Planctomycetaceae bacterium]|nr:hypothetical protein [Planctomycetaceae bacterium]
MIEDLYRVNGKAELIDGRIVPLMPIGRRPNRIAFRIAKSLDDHADEMVHPIACPVAYLHHPVECEDKRSPRIHICFGAAQKHLDQPKLYRKIT